MHIASSNVIAERLAKINTKSYEKPKDYLKHNVKLPKKLCHGFGGLRDEEGYCLRVYMSDVAVSY